MKRLLSVRFWLSGLCALVLLGSPLGAWANEADPPLPEQPELAAGIVISEIQTGATARTDEFIELFNATDEPVDLTGWQLRYITASETSTKTVEDPSLVITLLPPIVESEPVAVPAKGYFLLHSGAVALPADVVGQSYGGMLPATGGSLVLVRPENLTCELVVEDAVAWGMTTHLFGEGKALVPGVSSAKDRLLKRFVDPVGDYIDWNDNAKDFMSTEATDLLNPSSPGVAGSPLLPTAPLPGSGSTSQQYPDHFANADCTVPDPPDDPVTDPPDSPPSVGIGDGDDDPVPTIPSGNIGLKPPTLSELLPNPAPPQTDADDEFVELYNPNDHRFELSGYMLEVGLTTKRRFTFPSGTFIEPKTFKAFFSADTRLALSNSGSQVALVDPLGRVLLRTDPYSTAKDGQAWLFANGVWQWTTRPTPNALNVVSKPAVKAAKTTKIGQTSVKSASTTSRKTAPEKAEDVAQSAAVATTTFRPLHPGVLALVGVSAVLYGAYEYRHDVANRIYQFRANRAARAAARQSAKGR